MNTLHACIKQCIYIYIGYTKLKNKVSILNLVRSCSARLKQGYDISPNPKVTHGFDADIFPIMVFSLWCFSFPISFNILKYLKFRKAKIMKLRRCIYELVMTKPCMEMHSHIHESCCWMTIDSHFINHLHILSWICWDKIWVMWSSPNIS